MATKLGPVMLPFTLDTAEINRQIDQIAAKIKKTIPSASEMAGLGAMQALPLSEQRAGASAEKPEPVAKTIRAAEEKPSAGEKRDMKPSLISQIATTRAASSFLSGGASKVAMVAAGAAAVYGLASQTIKAIPEYLAAGAQIAGDADSPTVRFLQSALDEMRRRLVELESKVTSFFTAFGKTKDLTQASLRLSGRAPDVEYYGRLFKAEAEAETQLADRFDLWKRKEAPAVTVQVFAELFKRSVLR